MGNKPASGTEIIKELGEQHVRTGYPIVYTSGDSVLKASFRFPSFIVCARLRESSWTGSTASAASSHGPSKGRLGISSERLVATITPRCELIKASNAFSPLPLGHVRTGSALAQATKELRWNLTG